VPTQGCIRRENLTLLYVGIAPSAPSAGGKISKATLRSRLRQHLRGNAYGSTLRLTLGCLLRERLGIRLQRVGAGERLTFADGEARLNAWLAENAFVSWIVHDRPWEVESTIITSTSLPLNLSQNQSHPFCGQLSAVRAAARRSARELPRFGFRLKSTPHE
jgi:hypothetical protein